jgi:hypothetical protein
VIYVVISLNATTTMENAAAIIEYVGDKNQDPHIMPTAIMEAARLINRVTKPESADAWPNLHCGWSK